MADPDPVLITNPDFTVSHTFSIDDLTGGFDGLKQGDLPNGDTTIIDFNSTTTKNADGTILYPVNSDFGYVTTDFVGAIEKTRDDNPEYEEGWIGDLKGAGDVQAGVVISDAPTDTFKTPAVLGTWLAGLGGNTVKASTEHYVVMQNILSDAMYPDDPNAIYDLDDDLYVIGGTYDGMLMDDAIIASGDTNGDGVADIKDVLAPNETEIDINIAASTDYSVTVKDDGKLLYRWGNTIKKPNDMRLDIKLDLPDEFTEIDTNSGLTKLFKITAAELSTDHTVTNNPNDQIRPEDLENEAAIGQLPTYSIVSDYNLDGNGPREVWVTTDDYYAGDGTLYPAGTILRDDFLADNWASSDIAAVGAADGAAGFTNAWYTTMDREPFEADLNDTLDGYDIGPRWRLQPDKYGQDLPSVVIPLDPSLQPPPTKNEVKYDVGTDTTTVINLLDWGASVSPLSISAGYHNNSGTVSSNGVNMTNDLDVAFYIKGDVKPATLYDTTVLMNYEEITINAANIAVNGANDVDDYLVGQGGNTFFGGTGNDLFVVNYGGSGNWSALNASTITDFNLDDDMLSLIDLNVTDDNFLDVLDQTVVGSDLVIELGDNELVTLTGVTEELDFEEHFQLINRSVTPLGLVGTPGDDYLVGDSADNQMFGLAGNDTLLGLDGNDVLVGGTGADLMDGGDGDDIFFFDDDGDVVTGGAGIDRARMDNGAAGIDLTLTGWSGVEILVTSDLADTVDASSQTTGMTISTKDGDDSIIGTQGADKIFAGAGNDTLDGGDGNDALFGQGGTDLFYGGAGDDFFYLDTSTDRVADAGTGSDRAVLETADMSISVDATWVGLERIDASTGSETIDASAYSEAIVMLGKEGADTLTGGSGNDVLYGHAGADVLDGGSGGVDQLFGGAGDNAIDTFVFGDGSGVDRVRDWEDGFDLMDVSGITGVTGFGDLTIFTNATNTMVDAGNEMIVLVSWVDGVDGALTDADFLFA